MVWKFHFHLDSLCFQNVLLDGFPIQRKHFGRLITKANFKKHVFCKIWERRRQFIVMAKAWFHSKNKMEKFPGFFFFLKEVHITSNVFLSPLAMIWADLNNRTKTQDYACFSSLKDAHDGNPVTMDPKYRFLICIGQRRSKSKLGFKNYLLGFLPFGVEGKKAENSLWVQIEK